MISPKNLRITKSICRTYQFHLKKEKYATTNKLTIKKTFLLPNNILIICIIKSLFSLVTFKILIQDLLKGLFARKTTFRNGLNQNTKISLKIGNLNKRKMYKLLNSIITNDQKEYESNRNLSIIQYIIAGINNTIGIISNGNQMN